MLQPIAVTLEPDDLGVMHHAVDHGGGHGGVADSPQRPKGLLEVTMTLARS